MNQPQPDGRPRLSNTEATELLASRYGLAGTVESLPGYHDQNFRVQTESGERFVLKIANPEEDLRVLDLQMEALEFLADCEVGLKIPRAIPTTDGESRFSFSESGAPAWVRLLSYLEGDVLAGCAAEDRPTVRVTRRMPGSAGSGAFPGSSTPPPPEVTTSGTCRARTT